MTKRNTTAISDQLREAIRTSGQSLYKVAKESKIPSAILYRFMSGQRAPSMGTVDRLCKYLGLELRQAKGRERP
jgi:DNA-binding phage protein